jgi:hypothetical protein
MLINYYTICIQGRIQDFKLGGALKKLRRAEGGANIFGVFRVKNHDITPKNHIFSNFRGGGGGGGAPGAHPPLGSAPGINCWVYVRLPKSTAFQICIWSSYYIWISVCSLNINFLKITYGT